ncbi:MAG: hypothetical protein LBE13_13190 [Bacteroidales bacterium]|jgi:hypothetical protein|nr:hypothetical protein [Bacteroidales bacterium]
MKIRTEFKILSLVIFIFLLFDVDSILAEDSMNAVEIQIINNDKIDSQKFNVIVKVHFYDISLYNDEIYLSYHIYDLSGIVAKFENERYRITLDKNNDFIQNVVIDNIDVPCIIKFDIVDQKNIFWFLDNENIEKKFAEIKRENNMLMMALNNILSSIKEDIFLFLVNLSFFIMTVIILLSIKKELLAFRRNDKTDN